MDKSITILGINGRIGQNAARAFFAEGWRVTGFGRADRARIPGIAFLAGDADSPADVARAAAPSAVILDAVNLPYDKWGAGRYEKSLAARLAGLAGSGKTLLYPGNIYNYAGKTHDLRPDTPQSPARDKGEIRLRLEAMLNQATVKDNLKVAILRAPDFIGPDATGTLIDLVLLRDIGRGVLTYPGDPAIGHSYAYLPDLGRAFVRLAEARATLAPFDRLHFAGYFLNAHQLAASIERALGQPLRVKRLNWLPLRAASLFAPMLREVIKMNYLWDEPHRLIDPRLDALLGPDFSTPVEVALAATIRSFLPAAATAQAALAAA